MGAELQMLNRATKCNCDLHGNNPEVPGLLLYHQLRSLRPACSSLRHRLLNSWGGLPLN